MNMSTLRSVPLFLGLLALVTTLFSFYTYISNTARFSDTCELQTELPTPLARKETWESSNAVVGPQKLRYKGAPQKLRAVTRVNGEQIT